VSKRQVCLVYLGQLSHVSGQVSAARTVECPKLEVPRISVKFRSGVGKTPAITPPAPLITPVSAYPVTILRILSVFDTFWKDA
jgi:hypothetical protein